MQQDANKTNAQLLEELSELRQKNNELEAVVSNLQETGKTLQESEKRFKAIANYSFDWESWIGPDGEIMWMNPAVEKFTGYSAEEYINLPDRLQQIICDEDRDRILSHYENGVHKHQAANDIEFQLTRKDGSLTWASVSYQPIYTETGECLGMRSSIRDISSRKLSEQALRESEERFRAVAESSSDAIIIIDQDGTIIFWNDAAKEIFGYEEKEVLGKLNTILIPERLRYKDYGMRQNVLKTGRLTHNKKPFETVALRKDGTECTVETTFSDWKVKGQYFFSIIIRDITERKQRENALKESEEHFRRAIAEASVDAIYTVDQNGTIVFWNKAATKLFGYEENEAVGRLNTMLLPERFKEIDSKAKKQLFKTGVFSFKDKLNESAAIKKDGTEFPVELSISDWQVNDRKYFTVILRDITERKQHEDALREREERFKAIAESSPAAIITADSTGKILYWNKAAETIYGYKAKEIVGKSIELLRPESKRLADRKNRDLFIKTGRSRYIGKTVEGPARKKDGTVFLSETSTSYWKIGCEIIFCGIVLDITDRKRMEQELKKAHEELEKKVKQRTDELAKANKELQASRDYLKKYAGMLLSVREEERRNISTTLHDELGSMAISVDSPMSIAKEEVKDNNRNAAIGAIEQAQAALRKAVGDLRRLAADLRPPSLEIMGLTSALNDFIDNFKKHTTFKISFGNDLAKKKIPEDMAIVIYRVIQEALNNITRHAKANKVSVRLYPDKDKVHLDITDDGVGFDIDKVSKRRGKLKIGIQGMRERVESMGGEFSITSAPRQGTQLKAVLPK